MSSSSNCNNNWLFSQEDIENSPSRKCGLDADKELSYRQFSANLISDMAKKLHVFYMFHSFTNFPWQNMAAASLFLSSKVEEQPRKLEHFIKLMNGLCFSDTTTLDLKSDQYHNQSQDLIFNEHILLLTLGFDVAVDHPHATVVKSCELIKASNDLSKMSYMIATFSINASTMCIEYSPTVVACFCIYLASKWSHWEIQKSNEQKHWFTYVDKSVTEDFLEMMTNKFLAICDKCPSRMRRKFFLHMNMNSSAANSIMQPADNSGTPSAQNSVDSFRARMELADQKAGHHSHHHSQSSHASTSTVSATATATATATSANTTNVPMNSSTLHHQKNEKSQKYQIPSVIPNSAQLLSSSAHHLSQHSKGTPASSQLSMNQQQLIHYQQMQQQHHNPHHHGSSHHSQQQQLLHHHQHSSSNSHNVHSHSSAMKSSNSVKPPNHLLMNALDDKSHVNRNALQSQQTILSASSSNHLHHRPASTTPFSKDAHKKSQFCDIKENFRKAPSDPSSVPPHASMSSSSSSNKPFTSAMPSTGSSSSLYKTTAVTSASSLQNDVKTSSRPSVSSESSTMSSYLSNTTKSSGGAANASASSATTAASAPTTTTTISIDKYYEKRALLNAANAAQKVPPQGNSLKSHHMPALGHGSGGFVSGQTHPNAPSSVSGPATATSISSIGSQLQSTNGSRLIKSQIEMESAVSSIVKETAKSYSTSLPIVNGIETDPKAISSLLKESANYANISTLQLDHQRSKQLPHLQSQHQLHSHRLVDSLNEQQPIEKKEASYDAGSEEALSSVHDKKKKREKHKHKDRDHREHKEHEDDRQHASSVLSTREEKKRKHKDKHRSKDEKAAIVTAASTGNDNLIVKISKVPYDSQSMMAGTSIALSAPTYASHSSSSMPTIAPAESLVNVSGLKIKIKKEFIQESAMNSSSSTQFSETHFNGALPNLSESMEIANNGGGHNRKRDRNMIGSSLLSKNYQSYQNSEPPLKVMRVTTSNQSYDSMKMSDKQHHGFQKTIDEVNDEAMRINNMAMISKSSDSKNRHNHHHHHHHHNNHHRGTNSKSSAQKN